jgi:hypothetical protein
MGVFTLCWGSAVGNQAVGIVWRFGFVKCKWLHCVGAPLCKIKLLASFGGSVMQSGGVCTVLELSYVKRSCCHCLGVWLCETGGFASSWGSVMQKKMF